MADDSNVEQLSQDLARLPEDAREAFLDRFRGSFRISLVPGYRTATLFGRPSGCAYPFVLHASGSARTSAQATHSIRLRDLVHCIGPGASMPGGLKSPVETGAATTPGTGVTIVGSPTTVVTGHGPKPAVFTVTSSGFVDATQAGNGHLGWKDITVEAGAPEVVTVKSHQLGGDPLPGAAFDWHVTLEIRFVLFLGG